MKSNKAFLKRYRLRKALYKCLHCCRRHLFINRSSASKRRLRTSVYVCVNAAC
ncbi:50S ribosomal protein L35 [Candidatus Vidania fulgoroideae]|uniref:50S ribosomal protein L35 n=1 Tax=Candidatus Vidania fulgoroideorum TaxID=881286 RepID=A0A975ADN4_9PROT|nr:50S ribosomal protein L35 [Candidatus Vidania fulgoroideae]